MKRIDRRYLILVGGGLLFFFFLWWFGRGAQGPQPSVGPTGRQPETMVPEVTTQIPYSPTQVNLEGLANISLPQTVSTYQLQGSPQQPLTLDESELIGRNLSFTREAEERMDASGKKSFVFRDNRGRVLTINSDPPSLHYSEPTPTVGDVPSLDVVRTLAEEWLGKVGLQLPAGWEIKEVGSSYLAGHESVSVVVDSQDKANFTRVSFGYFYNGTLVVDESGRFDFLTFNFGRGGSIVSAKLNLLVNNPAVGVRKTKDSQAKNLEAVRQDFSSGKAQAVSLDLSGVSSDEVVLNPPLSVAADDLQSVLILSGGRLEPYLLVRTGGELVSGRRGRVVYLVSAAAK